MSEQTKQHIYNLAFSLAEHENMGHVIYSLILEYGDAEIVSNIVKQAFFDHAEKYNKLIYR